MFNKLIFELLIEAVSRNMERNMVKESSGRGSEATIRAKLVILIYDVFYNHL